MVTGTLGRVQSPRIIRIGGAAKETAEVLEQLGLSRPLIITDAKVANLHLSTLTDVLDGAGMVWGLFDQVVEDPTDVCVDAGLAALQSGDYDCVVGFGGGSPMETAKAVSFMSVNSEHVRDYKEPAQIDRCGVPIILIPTTGGTGSVLTRWCVITDTESPENYYLSGLACVATAAIIDWSFSLTKPARITANTAVDSLTHAIEAYVSRRAFPYTDAFALSAAQAGMAFSNASVALVHGMSRPIGAHFHVAHGLSNAMLLPTVTSFSVAAAPARYSARARIMDMAEDGDTDATACAKLVDGLRSLNTDLAVPSPRALGHDADEAMLEIMAQQALETGSPNNNPRVPTKEEIGGLHKEIW